MLFLSPTLIILLPVKVLSLVSTAVAVLDIVNRAIIVERAAVPFAEPVNVVPQPKAGGSFATALYARLSDPVALEEIKADAGLDIGGTLIGMHLKKVAVPLRLRIKQIGDANRRCKSFSCPYPSEVHRRMQSYV